MTMTHVETEPIPEADTARARVRIVTFISRNGTRAQKRLVSTGKAARSGAAKVGRGALNQITQPYTTAKIALGAVGLGALMGLLWYYSLVVCILTIMATGSVLLGIMAAVMWYMVMARFVYVPMLNLYGNYCENAQIHHGKMLRASGPSFIWG